MTIRKKIIELLAHEECDARLISQKLHISEKEAYDHLPHIERSVTAAGKRFFITPAACNTCGYIFKSRKKPTKPGRCPKCKNERIEPPGFLIK
jgi:predicted Zn-ribbon and HTH transcriptional regulator